MEILKLLFHHDLVLGHPSDNSNDVLALFAKPSPTYSFFRISCSQLTPYTNGLSNFSFVKEVLTELNTKKLIPSDFTLKNITEIYIDDSLSVLSRPSDYSSLPPDLTQYVENGSTISFATPSESGIDICLLSKKNVYEDLFYSLKGFISPQVRLFSMNGKRIQSDALFYFERLPNGRLPHGVEEVTADIHI